MVAKFVETDGGRKAAGYKGVTRDCACRSVAIISGKPYDEVYDSLKQLCDLSNKRRRKGSPEHPRTGIYAKTLHRLLVDRWGWSWTPTMGVGTGCQVHLSPDELPTGRLICRVSKHFVAVIDGVVHDDHDPSRDGLRCVYGYWQPPNP